MELFPAQPDLSLHISPLVYDVGHQDHTTFGLCKDTSKTTAPPSNLLELSLSNSKPLDPNEMQHYHQHHQYDDHHELNQKLPSTFGQQSSSSFHSVGVTRRRSSTTVPTKRSIRAPRMRWNSSLHEHFIRAINLLGGYQRATPKSVLELMQVKDLTLAHVKSHLQMYRTIKGTARRTAASSGHKNRLVRGLAGSFSEEDDIDEDPPSQTCSLSDNNITPYAEITYSSPTIPNSLATNPTEDIIHL